MKKSKTNSKKDRIVELYNFQRALKMPRSKTETETFKKIKVLLEEAFPGSKWVAAKCACGTPEGAKVRTGTCGRVTLYDTTLPGAKLFEDFI